MLVVILVRGCCGLEKYFLRASAKNISKNTEVLEGGFKPPGLPPPRRQTKLQAFEGGLHPPQGPPLTSIKERAAVLKGVT